MTTIDSFSSSLCAATFCSANARRQVKSAAFLLHVTVQSEQEHLDKQFQHKPSDTMFHALNERAKGSGGARYEDYDPANAYFTALAGVHLSKFVPADDISWADMSQHAASMVNVLPPTLPERSTFVRRPRSLTEQSDLSELSVEDAVADQSSATLRDAPTIVSPTKAGPKAVDTEDFDSLLSEFSNSDMNRGTSNEKSKEIDANSSVSETTKTAAATSALEFLGIPGATEGGGNKKKKKKKKKGKKTDSSGDNGGKTNGGNDGGKATKKKKQLTAAQIAVQEAAARRSKHSKKKKK